jgi:hypothetical protein
MLMVALRVVCTSSSSVKMALLHFFSMSILWRDPSPGVKNNQ